jgi:DNA repair exonuclease SbcCD ATPase subunit
MCKPKVNEAGEIIDKDETIEKLTREIEESKEKLRKEELRNRDCCNKISDQLKHMKVQKEKFEEAETKVDELKNLVKEV